MSNLKEMTDRYTAENGIEYMMPLSKKELRKKLNEVIRYINHLETRLKNQSENQDRNK